MSSRKPGTEETGGPTISTAGTKTGRQRGGAETTRTKAGRREKRQPARIRAATEKAGRQKSKRGCGERSTTGWAAAFDPDDAGTSPAVARSREERGTNNDFHSTGAHQSLEPCPQGLVTFYSSTRRIRTRTVAALRHQARPAIVRSMPSRT